MGYPVHFVDLNSAGGMTDQIRKSYIKIRKTHKCFACNRRYLAGDKMYMSTNRNDDRIYNMYNCDACEALMSEFYYGIDDDENAFFPGCVSEGLKHGQTPEMLLEELRTKTATP
jgi:hypothetical protein